MGTLCTLCIGPNEVMFSWEIANAKMLRHLGFAFVVILPMVRPANLQFWSQRKHWIKWIWTQKSNSVQKILEHSVLVIDIQFFLWRRRRQRLETWLVLVVYCPAAYVPHGRGGQKCHQGNQAQSREKWDFSQVQFLQLSCWCNLWSWRGIRDSGKLFHHCNFFDLK